MRRGMAADWPDGQACVAEWRRSADTARAVPALAQRQRSEMNGPALLDGDAKAREVDEAITLYGINPDLPDPRVA
ncbi:MAG: hypothetical protein ACRDZO_23350 [Egibacteraceae bacterium]